MIHLEAPLIGGCAGPRRGQIVEQITRLIWIGKKGLDGLGHGADPVGGDYVPREGVPRKPALTVGPSGCRVVDGDQVATVISRAGKVTRLERRCGNGNERAGRPPAITEPVEVPKSKSLVADDGAAQREPILILLVYRSRRLSGCRIRRDLVSEEAVGVQHFIAEVFVNGTVMLLVPDFRVKLVTPPPVLPNSAAKLLVFTLNS